MQTIRVFISSTFHDMHAERDHINSFVMPELRSRCLRRGAELVGIDLRWGITEEESRKRGTLEACLDEIRRSTFFLCLLGDRFGTVMPPEEIPADRYRAACQARDLDSKDINLLGVWYMRDETSDSPTYVLRRNRKLQPEVARRLVRIWQTRGLPHAGDSITTREVLEGALCAKRSTKRAFFYLRRSGLHLDPAFPDSFVSSFEEDDPQSIAKLTHLKKQIQKRTDESFVVRKYDAGYSGLRIDPGLLPASLSPHDRKAMKDGVVEPGEWPSLSKATRAVFDVHGTVALTGIEELGQQVIADLWAAIEAELDEHVEIRDSNEREWTEHEQFLSERTQRFVGRKKQLESMLRYAGSQGAGQPLVVTGEPGCGKSTLLAEFARRCRSDFPKALVLPYFVGAAADTIDLTATVRFLCSTLQRECNLDEGLPTDPEQIRVALPGFLERAAAVRPVILILDALNQLDPANGSHELYWLPLRLPAGVRIIVSSLSGDCLDHLRKNVSGRNMLRVRGLPRSDRMKLVQQQLARRGKKLSRTHLAKLLETKHRTDADRPLYLMVALEELALVGGRKALDRRIESLPATLESLFDKVLERLEWDHTRDLCASVLKWLAVSRSGLRELEILELLGADYPQIRWAQLYRSLEFYLRPANETTGSGLIGFYHNQLRSAVFRRYLGMRSASSTATTEHHHAQDELAAYFRRIASDSRGPSRWHTGRPRGLGELPYHLFHAERKEELRDVLLDFDWLRARLEASDVITLVADYEYLSDDPSMRRIQRAIRLSSHTLDADKTQLAGQLVGRLAGERDAGVRRTLTAARRWHAVPWLRPLMRSLTNPSNDLVQTLAGHSDAVFDFALTPDGRYVISGSRDKTLKLWELSSGRVIHTLTGHSKMVLAVEVTPDGRRAISASKDRTVRVWDLISGRLLHTLKGHRDEVDCIAMTPNGRRVISGSRRGFLKKPFGVTFKTWELSTGHEENSFFRTGEGIYFREILTTRKGFYIVLERWGGTLSIVDLIHDRVVCTIDNKKDLQCAAANPDGRAIVLGYDDGRIELWSLVTGSLIRLFDGHKGHISTVWVTPDGRELISGSSDRTVRTWNLATGRQKHVLSGHSGTVASVRRTPDARYVISSSYDSSLKVWDPSGEGIVDRRKGHTDDVRGLVLTPCGNQLISCSEDGTIGIWNVKTGHLIRTFVGHDDSILSIAITRDGKFVLSGSNDCTIKIWETSSWKKLRTLPLETGSIAALAATPDGRFVLSGSWDNAVTVWDMKGWRKLRSLRKHTSQVNSVALTPDGRRVVSGSDDRSILVRKLNGRTAGAFTGHSGYVNAVAVTPEGRYVVSGSADRTVRVWELDSGTPICTLRGHARAVNCIAVTPSGRHVVSGSDDMTVKVFEIESRRCVATFTAEGEVRACAVTGDLDLVAAGTADGRVHFLRFEKGRQRKAVTDKGSGLNKRQMIKKK